MQRRYRHYLEKRQPAQPCKRVICVAVDGSSILDSSSLNRRRERITCWRAVVLHHDGVRYVQKKELQGETADTFWHGLQTMPESNCPVQILSYQCTRVWSLLSFWEAIENGAVQIEPETRPVHAASPGMLSALWPDMASGGGGLSKLPGVQRVSGPLGYLVCEDPPNIARFSLRDRRQAMTWWDVRNWGVEPAGESLRAERLAQWLAEWVASLTDSLSAAGLGAPSVTSGTTAMASYRATGYEGGIYMHTDAKALALEQAAYHGGRCECYRMGEALGYGYMVDVRSMYGAICASVDVPKAMICHYWSAALPEIYQSAADDAWVAWVHVETDRPLYPMVRDGDVVFPVGRFETALCGPELAVAVRAGHVRLWREAVRYSSGPALVDYARRLCQLRDDSRDALPPGVDAALKRLLCCLPGKFAQRLRRWERKPALDGVMQYGELWSGRPGGDAVRTRYIGGCAYVDVDMGLHPDANLAIAAWITAHGRVRLRQLCEIAGLDHVWYVDTDALIVDAAGLSALRRTEPSVMGDTCGLASVRHEGMVSIYGLKHYSIGDHHVCAGLPRGVLTDAGDGLHHWYSPAGSEQIGDGTRPTASARRIAWPRRHEYRHGIVGGDGRVTPIVLREG